MEASDSGIPEGFFKWPVLQRTLLELPVDFERRCVRGCGMTHPFCLDGFTFIVDRLSRGPAWHTRVFIPTWSLLIRKHLLIGLPFCFTATLQAVKWSSDLVICLRKAIFPLLVFMAAKQQKSYSGKPYDFLPSICFETAQKLYKNTKSEVYQFVFAPTGHLIFCFSGKIGTPSLR